jgi:hypothetical protein
MYITVIMFIKNYAIIVHVMQMYLNKVKLLENSNLLNN